MVTRKKILAADCSLRVTGVALSEGERIVACEARDLGRRQASELPLITEGLLRKVGWAWSDLDLLAVTNGPGYFTGLRVGAAYVMGLAFGLGLKIIPVSSLEMLALSYSAASDGDDRGVLAVAYAGRDAVYAASFFTPGVALEVGEYTGAALGDWLAYPENVDVTIVSDDPERAAQAAGLPELAKRMKLIRPDVSRVALAALGREHDAVAPEALKLTYCRKAV